MSAVADYAGMTIQQVKAAIEASVKDEKGPLRGVTDLAVSQATAALAKAKEMAPQGVVDQVAAGFSQISLKMNEVYKFKTEDYVDYARVTSETVKSWGVEALHFDYLAYSKQVMANNSDPIQQKLAAAVAELEKARAALQAEVSARAADGKEKAGEAQEALMASVAKASEAATALAGDAVKFVEDTKGKLPAPAEKSVDFIMDSPNKMKALADEVKGKADLDSSKKVLDNVSSLAVAVKEVLYAHVVSQSSA